MAMPPRLPTVRPVGPPPKEPRQWDRAAGAVDEAYAKAQEAVRDPSRMPAALEAQRLAYQRVAEAAEMELQETLQATDELREAIKGSRSRRGRAPRMERVQVTFAAASRGTTPPSPTGARYREAGKQAHLLQAHARQAVRTEMPRIDGATTPEFRERLLAKAEGEQPAELKALFLNMTRTCNALVAARNGPNWQAVRIRAMRQAGSWAKQAEELLTLRQKQEAQEDAKSWQAWCKRAAAGGAGRAHRWTKHSKDGQPSEVITADGGE